jgi:transcriptional regulator GlxA family with amidase domain
MSHAPDADVEQRGDGLSSGFLDQATFSRMFKRGYGLTPREARESARERL